MTTIKSYTDLKQSKKLAEFLPLKSADMCWYLATKGNPKAMFNEGYNKYGDFELPCWSLTALLNILPNGIVMNKDSQNGRYHFSSKYIGTYVTADNPIDACVEVIEKLHKQNLL